MTNLNGGTLFNAEFGIRHRAAPYRKGQVLHSVFAAAIAMDMAGVVSRQGNMYAWWEYNNNRIVIQAVGVDLPAAMYMPVVFAKPVL